MKALLFVFATLVTYFIAYEEKKYHVLINSVRPSREYQKKLILRALRNIKPNEASYRKRKK